LKCENDALTKQEKMMRVFVLAVVLTFGFSIGSWAQEVEVPWRVKTPFRLIVDSEFNSKFVADYRKINRNLSVDEKKTPILSIEHKLQSGNWSRWAKQIFLKDQNTNHQERATCWHHEMRRFYTDELSADGKSPPKAGCSDFMAPENIAIVAGPLSGTTADALCTWKLNGNIAIKENACTDPVNLNVQKNDGDFKATLEVDISNAENRTVEVEIEDLLIAGLGDSFGSGEGNPDKAIQMTGQKAMLGRFPYRDRSNKENWRNGARWHDWNCHRSLYNQQLRAAMHMALSKKNRSVGFIGLACSGATIRKGLLGPYIGVENTKHRQLSEKEIRDPQLHALLGYLCEGGRKNVNDDAKSETNFSCKTRLKRKLDFLFLSVGGNDIGFSGIVAYSILQASGVKQVAWVLSQGDSLGGYVTPKEAKEKIDSILIPDYARLKRTLNKSGLLKDNRDDRVLLSGYPQPFFQSDGKTYCPEDRPSGRGMEVFDTFTFWPKEKLLKRAFSAVEKLDRSMLEAAQKTDNGPKGQWRFVSGHQEEFRKHGFCAGEKAELAPPTWVNGKGWSKPPNSFNPYQKRQRWMRTPNDAYLTTNNGGASVKSLEQNPGDVIPIPPAQLDLRYQKALARTINGAMHPTAEGHAYVADHVSCTAENFLENAGAPDIRVTGCKKE